MQAHNIEMNNYGNHPSIVPQYLKPIQIHKHSGYTNRTHHYYNPKIITSLVLHFTHYLAAFELAAILESSFAFFTALLTMVVVLVYSP